MNSLQLSEALLQSFHAGQSCFFFQPECCCIESFQSHYLPGWKWSLKTSPLVNVQKDMATKCYCVVRFRTQLLSSKTDRDVIAARRLFTFWLHVRITWPHDHFWRKCAAVAILNSTSRGQHFLKHYGWLRSFFKKRTNRYRNPSWPVDC